MSEILLAKDAVDVITFMLLTIAKFKQASLALK